MTSNKKETNKKETNKTEFRRRGRPQTNPNSLANLRPATKNEVRNPNGRPVGSRHVTTVLREMLQEIAPAEVLPLTFIKQFCRGLKRVTNADAIAARMQYQAIIEGDMTAIREILDRTEGKPKQTVDVKMVLEELDKLPDDELDRLIDTVAK